MSRRLLFALLAMTTAQAAVYVARPMTSYRLLGLGEGARAVGLVTAAFALLPLFLAFEVIFYGLLEVLSERTNELFPFWAVVGANTLAAVCMGLYLWRRHPALRRSIQETPLGAAPS